MEGKREEGLEDLGLERERKDCGTAAAAIGEVGGLVPGMREKGRVPPVPSL